MPRRFSVLLPLFFAGLLTNFLPVAARDTTVLEGLAQEASQTQEIKKDALKVFIDCGACDMDYIRTEITYVNYVRDRKEAQVHVLVTTQRTGGGGREYTLSFIGQLDQEGVNDTQKYFSGQTDTEDEIRAGLTEALEVGLMSYVAKTPLARRIDISYSKPAAPDESGDPWDSWVFRLSSSGYLRGEKSFKDQTFRGGFAASRITPELKLKMSLSVSQSRQDFDFEDESIENVTEEYAADGLFVKSLNEHWSVGFFLRAESSTYENIEFALNPAPAVEFNVFPYSESTRRQLRILYRLGLNAIRYREQTIYDKTSENLWSQSLSVSLSLKEKWGSVSTSLSGSHYFHDFDKNRLTLFNIVSLRLFKGLNVFAFGGGSRIHDQLGLVKGSASLEEVLLRRTQLETSYDYFFSVGVSFTFGSIFTNVVNPRFGSHGSGGMTVIID